MKILLINSDLAKNRGDRAIAEGIVELIKQRFPEAKITGLSERAERDKEWFGIDFLNMDSQSLKPGDFFTLLRTARRSDIVLWGGGEILKDYTNKLALWYWTLKIFCISSANKNIYGSFQGIGPTSSGFSKFLIARVVRRCRKFIVRDHESYEKLQKWGVPTEKLISSSDPAVVPTPGKLSVATEKKLRQDFQIDKAFLDNFVSMGPRGWFHYKQGGLIPFKYKQAVRKALGVQSTPDNSKYILYKSRLVAATDELIERHDINVLLTPMHMGESDRKLCEHIRDHSKHPDRIRILAEDSLSPTETRSLIAHAKAAIGFRLHSTIISTSCDVPSVNIYYVDKGRVFFDQIGQSHFAFPIEKVLEDDFLPYFSTLFAELMADHKKVTRNIHDHVSQLRTSTKDAFQEITHDN